MPTTTVDRTSGAEFRLTVELAPEDYKKRADAELKRLAKGAKIKGFRPGKVPVGFMRKQYGKSALLDAISKAIDEEVQAAIEDNDLDVFGKLESVEEADLSQVTSKFEEPLRFVFEGGTLPEAKDLDAAGLKDVHRFSVSLTDEEADEKIAEASKRFVDYLERDTVETEEDFATLVVSDEALDKKFYGEQADAHSAEPTVGNDAKDDADAETHEHDGGADAASAKTEDADSDDDTGNEADAGDDAKQDAPEEQEEDPRQKYFLRPAELLEEQRYKLVDKAVGTEIILALADLREDVRERFGKAIDADGTTTFTIAKVDREQLPEMNEETYAKIFGEDAGVTTEEEARTAFRERFLANSQESLDDFTLEHVIDALDAANPLDVPMKAMKARIEEARAEEQKKAAEENRAPQYDHEPTEADRHGLGRRIKWMAYRKALLEEHEVELDAADVDEMVEREYTQQLAGMGIDPNQFRDQFFETFKTNLLQNREKMMELTDAIMTKKLLGKLEEEGVLGARKELSEKEFSQTVEVYNKRVGEELEELRKQVL